jgi:hypothetical protein
MLKRDTITESSLKCGACHVCFGIHLCIKKIKGERTQPWGDLVEEKRTSDKTPFTLTRCDLTVKKYINQQSRPASMLKRLFNLSAKTRDWMQLKAEENSIKGSRTRDLASSRCLKTMFKSVPVS